jgi:CHAT domain-containing protein
MDNQQRQHLEELRLTHQRRLQVLKLQSARFGTSAPPHILTEIEDIEEQIVSIDARLVELEQSAPQHSAQKAIVVILFLSADPTDVSRLRLGEELREIQEKLQLAKLREHFELQQRMSVRPADISQALLDVQPQVVHFSGHGVATGALCFENQVGETHPIQPDALAALFEQFADQVNCVILNACYSETQANAIAQHIDYVIGMNQAIGDKAALAFAIGFYQALGAGRTVEEAYNLGHAQIRLQNIPEYLTPVLIKKGQAQP